MSTLKCVSLWQPWASLCVLPSLADPDEAVKPYETRHWGTNYRGLLLIHSAKKWTREQSSTCLQDEFQSYWSQIMQLCGKQPLGCIVGAVELVDVYQVQTWAGRGRNWTGLTKMLPNGFQDTANAIPLPTGDAIAFGDFSTGRYAWKLAKPRMFKTPIPYTGRQGFFNVPDSVVAAEMATARAVGGAV